ncbi:PREDICTED: uncharacterized protein LOC109163788 [Ipomoea nil]|uniref:uncharacterized protein LOC109163788 n=1 Tax=Ipomoea nil TaxID=35883 RepID=UPI000900ED89|nr:PREDICTED: uncharacterized protein LOC109163788 [Ipomoea nil]
MGGRIDKQINSGSSPPIFRLNGQNFHLMGRLLPIGGNSAKFAQLYIHDYENEVMNRISVVRNESDVQDLHPQIVADIQAILDYCNVLVKSFRMAKEAIQSNPRVEVKMKLIGKRSRDARTYNLPTVSEVAALIVGDLDAHLVENGSRQRISPREYLTFCIHERLSEVSTILYARRLFQQFLVDGYTMVEAGRLLYIRTNQKSLRCGAYQGLSDALTRGDVEPDRHGKRVILPSSFNGGARYMIQNYQDALVICGWIGYPNLFITFTCNPKWPEIERYLGERHLSAVDRPDIICRLFKMKLDALIREIHSGLVFGNVTAVIYTVEFQKRGLPHAHILIFLGQEDGQALCQNIDTIISAEIPNKEVDSEYYKVVEEFMIHGLCGHLRKNSPCMVNGRCSKHFPKKFVDSSNFDQDGYPIYRRRDDGREGQVVDEISMFYDCRYISACEGTWRLFGFDIQFRVPAVERLSFHLPNQQLVVYGDDDDCVDNILSRPSVGESMFLAWFEAKKKFAEAKELTYGQMPNKFVWKKDVREWHLRRKGFAIGRMFFVPPGSGEIYYLRCLLNLVRGETCYEDLCIVEGVQYSSFRDACCARGLLADDKEYVDAINETSKWASATSMRRLFVTMLTSNVLIRPEVLLDEELLYDCDALKVEHDNLVEKLTDEQRHVYDIVLSDVANAGGGLFFVYGYGGTGKTFVWKTLSAALRFEGHIVLNVASSGIASLLLPGGRTAHSRFAIPINITEDSTCNISQGNDLANLIINSKLIILDEAPMMHKHCFEALDRTMRDLLRFVNPLSTEMTFGGKTVVLGGDFRQILPVIPKGTRKDIVGASINSSYLWQNCKVLRLTKNLRLQRLGNDDSAEDINSFSKWIAGIGDGLIGGPNDGCAVINIPEQNVFRPHRDSISAIVNSTFPEFCSAIITYFSSDSVCQSNSGVDTLAGLHTTEFLNTLKCLGIPNHCLMLQVGSPVMLLRNIDYTLSLCNGMRLDITKLGDHVVEAKVMSGSCMGTRVLIPRLLTPSDPRLPFKFQRR